MKDSKSVAVFSIALVFLSVTCTPSIGPIGILLSFLMIYILAAFSSFLTKRQIFMLLGFKSIIIYLKGFVFFSETINSFSVWGGFTSVYAAQLFSNPITHLFLNIYFIVVCPVLVLLTFQTSKRIVRRYKIPERVGYAKL